jgi:hypothetical protein
MDSLGLDLIDAFGEQAVVGAAMVGTWGTDRFPTAQIEALRDRFQVLLGGVRALPGGTAEIEEVNAGLVRALTLIIRGYDQYLLSAETGQVELLERGDDNLIKGQEEFFKARPAVEEVIGAAEDPFGAEFRDLGNDMRVINLELNEALKVEYDMLDALESGRLRVAANKAGEAEAIMRTTVSRLEALPTPENEHLRSYLRDTLAAHRLLQAAFGDYRRGIPAPDLDLVNDGDRKAFRGFRLAAQAAGRLAAAAKAEAQGSLD